jgi:hypothetical protein
MGGSEKNITPPAAAKPRGVSPLLLFVLLFVIYNVNFRNIRFGDTAPARVLPFSILLDHTLYLDNWFGPYLHTTAEANGTYYLRPARGHVMSAYPIIMPVVLTPFYVVPAWLVSRQNPPLAHNDVLFIALLDVMGKLCASLIAALSGMVLFLALRRICSEGLRLFLALVYGLASSTWSISSQGLWRHGFTELCFALLLWGLLHDERHRRRALWCGVALAGAASNNLANGIVVLLFLIYFARRGRREFVSFFSPLAILGSLVVGYNFYFFGKLLGGYPSVVVHSAQGSHLFRAAPVWTAALGMFMSPNRGLLIYMPWAVFALWGMARAWKENTYGWERYLIAGMAGFFIEHSLMGTWWGGWSFGPRYPVSVLPFLVFFLVPILPRIQSRRLLRAALIATLAASLWIQTVGAFYYPQGDWDALPVEVDRNPQRLWDWKDNQIRRSWQAGAARPSLFYELFLLSDWVEGANRAPVRQRSG